MSFKSVLNWWNNQDLRTEEDYITLLENYQIIFTCNSNNIEGDLLSYHTTREIFENAPITESGLLPRQIFEVRNQKFAFNFIIKALLEKQPITIDFILNFHKIMLYGSYDARWKKGERPGTFKVNDCCVGITEEGTPPQYVEEDLIELLNEVNTTKGAILTVAAYLHANFEIIHPFADGNGRVGRTLINYYLMLNGYPPMVIFNEDKNTYFMGLEVFDRTGELSGLVVFFKEQLVKTWNKKVVPDYERKLRWCRDNAPQIMCNASDEELLEAMSSAYEKFGNIN